MRHHLLELGKSASIDPSLDGPHGLYEPLHVQRFDEVNLYVSKQVAWNFSNGSVWYFELLVNIHFDFDLPRMLEVVIDVGDGSHFVPISLDGTWARQSADVVECNIIGVSRWEQVDTFQEIHPEEK